MHVDRESEDWIKLIVGFFCIRNFKGRVTGSACNPTQTILTEW